MLKIGDSGEDVKHMQAALKACGYDYIVVDGNFGPKTEAVLKAYQAAHGLAVDGVYGPATQSSLAGAPKPVPAPSAGLQNEALATESLKEGLSHLGVKEVTGHNDGPFINMIQKWYGGAGELGAPWCALFCMWCIYTAAAKLGITPKLPKSDSSTDLYAFAKKHGLLLSAPIPGCIGLMKGDGGDPSKDHHHTFRVRTVDAVQGIVNGLDGNWTNAVALTTHRIGDCDYVAVA